MVRLSLCRPVSLEGQIRPFIGPLVILPWDM
jgi:hypothetical protein